MQCIVFAIQLPTSTVLRALIYSIYVNDVALLHRRHRSMLLFEASVAAAATAVT